MNGEQASSVVVLYDGACPLCSREIAHYRRRRGAGGVRWIDASVDTLALAAPGIAREQALARFHVRDPDGTWHTGAAGFVELWSHLRGYALLARLVRGFRLLPLLERAYARWLGWRGRCDGDRCDSVARGGQ